MAPSPFGSWRGTNIVAALAAASSLGVECDLNFFITLVEIAGAAVVTAEIR